MHISVIYKQRWNCSTFSALMSQSLANEKRFNRYNANGKPLQLEWIVFKLWKLLLQFKICWNNLKISHFGLKISRALAISVMLPLKPEYTKKKFNHVADTTESKWWRAPTLVSFVCAIQCFPTNFLSHYFSTNLENTKKLIQLIKKVRIPLKSDHTKRLTNLYKIISIL